MSWAQLHRAGRPRHAVRISAAMVVIAATLLLQAGVARAQQPTLQFDRPCYTDMQEMRFTGAGYTPGGEVNLLWMQINDVRGSYTTRADAAGNLADYAVVGDVDQLLRNDEDRETIFVTANDLTRVGAGQQPPESQFGIAQFTFTRWLGFSPGTYVPGRTATVEVFGWTFAAGQVAWFQFRKGSRVAAVVKVGQLDAVYGDRKAQIRVPRGLKAGKYRLVLSTERRGLSERYAWRWGRVTRTKTRAIASREGRRMAIVNTSPSKPSGF